MSQADDRRESNQPPVAPSEADAENQETGAGGPAEGTGEPAAELPTEAPAEGTPESEPAMHPALAETQAFESPATEQLPPPEGGLLDRIGAEPAAEEPLPEEEKAKEEEEPKEKKPGFFQRLGQSSPYNMMLVIAILAILVGILCLAAEWKAYNYTTKKQDIKKVISAVPSSSTRIGELTAWHLPRV